MLERPIIDTSLEGDSMTDPLLKESLIFFEVWPAVILLTIVLGMRLGKSFSRNVEDARLKLLAVHSADAARCRL